MSESDEPHLSPAVFLDRDGVLNRVVIRAGKPYPPSSLAELEILPGAPEALRALKAAGFRLIVVTNQPDVARGTVPLEAVKEIHDALRTALPLDDIFVCYHDNKDGCACRKPKPGMLLLAAERHGLNLAASFMIGDRWKDIDAGRAAGCRTVFIDYGYRERQPDPPADFTAASLTDAAKWILEQ